MSPFDAMLWACAVILGICAIGITAIILDVIVGNLRDWYKELKK